MRNDWNAAVCSRGARGLADDTQIEKWPAFFSPAVSDLLKMLRGSTLVQARPSPEAQASCGTIRATFFALLGHRLRERCRIPQAAVANSLSRVIHRPVVVTDIVRLPGDCSGRRLAGTHGTQRRISNWKPNDISDIYLPVFFTSRGCFGPALG